MKKKVYCKGCAFLFRVDESNPYCLAKVKFIDGPLRPKIDIEGRGIPEFKNMYNDCLDRRVFSLHANQVKKWILWRLNDGTNKVRGATTLKSYPVTEEEARVEAFRNRKREKPAARRERTETPGEDVLPTRGIGDSDDSDSADDRQFGQQHFFDTESDDGQVGADVPEGEPDSDS